MHSSFYLSLLAIAYYYCSFEVIKQRRINKAPYGFGSGKDILKGHIAAHGNFAAYTPIFLILLIMAENSWALPWWAVHFMGSAFLVGRYVHYVSLTKKEHQKPPVFKFRVAGMMITFFCLLGLAGYILVRYLLKLSLGI